MADRDLLETCDEKRREMFVAIARRAVSGPRMRDAAIRTKCLECCAWSRSEARNCKITNCALWGLGGQQGEGE